MTRRYVVTGRVQGVGFRDFVRSQARRCGVAGWVRNTDDGSVEATASGNEEGLNTFEKELRRGPTLSRVDSVAVAVCEEISMRSFEVRA